MISLPSYRHKQSLDTSLASVSSNLRFSKIRFRRLRQKFSVEPWQISIPINTSSTTVGSSDISLKIPEVALGDLSYPLADWGHQATPTAFRPTFYKLLSKLVPQTPQPVSPNSGQYKTHGTTSHQSQSNKSDKAGHKRESTGKGARDFGSSGGGKGGKGGGSDEPPPPPYGYRFPHPGDARPPKHLGCPFYITEPLRHHHCSNLRLSRPSDVSQHIMRKHLLRDINLVLRRGTKSTDTTEPEEKMQQAGTCTKPDGIRRYHATCRMEFYGPTAEENLQYHIDNVECCEMGIEETGVMLPAEFKNLTKERDAVSGTAAKWYAIWRLCYPAVFRTTSSVRTVPASPYIETTAPREQGEHVIRQAQRSISMGDRSLNLDQIINDIYLGSAQPDTEVQQIVQKERLRRQFELQEASRSSLISSLPQQYQISYPTTFPSIAPSTLSLQTQFGQPPYQNTSHPPPGPQALPETSDAASQQVMVWHWNSPTN
ncbi:hypothetical protein FGADI_5257 [Fusarium gaditjirri]|uniref:Uncharacterized protein n=1 Tax=Fusarium gaditjirri TaxID=282569 RepID=A0A8H4TAW1_9HYPO|nr:hypothetical protein FGADI_5257 [Fusarium gaditjirri]